MDVVDSHLPSARRAPRIWRACMRQTLRQLRAAARRGRPISRPAAERLFLRTFRRAAPALDAHHARLAEQAGRARVRQWYANTTRPPLRLRLS